jgi:hypothetical protein
MTEREQFEAWVKSKDSTAPLHRRDMKGSERIGQYCVHWIQDQWESWQASRRAALEEVLAAIGHEHLCNPTDSVDDIAYEQAIIDCENAIRALSQKE